MNLVEQTTVPTAALPVAEFRDYLRLGTGFADDALQDGVLETCLRAALGAIEARTGKVLFERAFRLTLSGWRDVSGQRFSIAPVNAVTRFALVDHQATEVLIDPAQYVLVKDQHQPVVKPVAGVLPVVPVNGTVELDFTAGFGAAWSDIPAALQKAVQMLAAHYYEHRHAMAFEADGIPPVISEMLLPYLGLRLFGGRGA